MKRILIAIVASALVAGVVGLASLQPVSAQPGGPSVCLSLPPGEHTFTAPSQERGGEVSFTVTVGEGGVVTAFTEPGGQSIPPAAMYDIFTGEDAYPLPEGVSFTECEGADDSMMDDGPSADVCINLPAGVHESTVNVSGQSQPITLDIAEGGVVRGIAVLGQTYTAAEGLALMEQFGVSLPTGISIVECAAPSAPGSADAQPTLYANTGTGGLADTTDRTGLWAGLGSLAVLAIAAAAVAQRRRAAVRNRD